MVNGVQQHKICSKIMWQYSLSRNYRSYDMTVFGVATITYANVALWDCSMCIPVARSGGAAGARVAARGRGLRLLHP